MLLHLPGWNMKHFPIICEQTLPTGTSQFYLMDMLLWGWFFSVLQRHRSGATCSGASALDRCKGSEKGEIWTLRLERKLMS